MISTLDLLPLSLGILLTASTTIQVLVNNAFTRHLGNRVCYRLGLSPVDLTLHPTLDVILTACLVGWVSNPAGRALLLDMLSDVSSSLAAIGRLLGWAMLQSAIWVLSRGLNVWLWCIRQSDQVARRLRVMVDWIGEQAKTSDWQRESAIH